MFGINPDMQVIDKLFKELILFTARAAQDWRIFNELLCMKYTKEKTGPYLISFSHFLCPCITDFFLSVDIQIV